MLGFPNPLVGPNLDELGPRFPDMSEIYDPALRAVLRRKARELNIETAEGVYAQLTGPSFETPAEVRLLRSFGATAVGMAPRFCC